MQADKARGEEGQRISVTVSPLAWLVAWAAATALLLWPLALNGAPVLFYDSEGYLRFGDMIWAYAGGLAEGPRQAAEAAFSIGAAGREKDADGIAMGGRSYFYSIAAWAARGGVGFEMIAVAQALWLSAVALLAMGRLGIAGIWQRVGVVAVLAFLTPLAFFVCTIMPDVFAAIVPLAIGLLFAFGRSMSTAEKLFWTGSLLAAVLFHKSLLALAVLMLVAALLWARARRWPGSPGLALVATVLVSALVLDAAADRVAERISQNQMLSPPFLLARGIGDGTIGRVLAEDCARPQPRWASCVFAPYLPMTENELLWGDDGFMRLPPAQRVAITAEQIPLLAEAVFRSPVRQVTASFGNAWAQLIDPNVLEFLQPGIKAQVITTPDPASVRAYLRSGVPRGEFPVEPLSMAWRLIYLASLLGAVALLVGTRGWRERTDPRIVALLWLLLLSLPVSAAITGVISGPMGRYQARISWLALLVVCVIAARMRAPVANVPGDALPAFTTSAGVRP